MEPHEYLRVLRRRKLLVILAILVGATAGWVTAPGAAADQPTEFEAVHTLIASPSAPEQFNLEQAAVLVTTGAVPTRVAAAFAPGSDPVDLLRRVKVTPQPSLGTIEIAVTGTDTERITQLSDLFAAELISALNGAATDAYESSVEVQTQRVSELRAQVDQIRSQLPAVLPDSDNQTVVQQQLLAELEATTSQLQTATEDAEALRAQGAPVSPLLTLEAARALPVTEQGFQPPDSKPGRALLLAVFGLLVGVGMAFASERLDTRLRSKAAAERAFGLPVIAEIPSLPPGRRFRNTLVTTEHPAAPFVEAYRSLRTVVILTSAAAHLDPDRVPELVDGDHQVVLVTSPGAGEGKTTSVAHLAVLLAEAGRSVLVVSADFRRPRIHELFNAEREPGLSEVLTRRPGAPVLSDLELRTAVPGVKLLASGAPVDNPAPFLAGAASLIRAARELFDFVLIDTAPILIANDAAELAQCSDMVVMVARAGKTTDEAAHRAAEVLRRIDAPVIGSVLVAAEDTPAAQGYYRNRYYTDVEQRSRFQRLVLDRFRRHHDHAHVVAHDLPSYPRIRGGEPTPADRDALRSALDPGDTIDPASNGADEQTSEEPTKPTRVVGANPAAPEGDEDRTVHDAYRAAHREPSDLDERGDAPPTSASPHADAPDRSSSSW